MSAVDARRRSDKQQTHRPHRANVWRQKIAPFAAAAGNRVAAALALRRREVWKTRPAQAANNSRLDARQEPLARNANTRQKKIDRAGTVLPKADPSLWARYRSDCRIASRSASIPNHRWKESAPCSSNIGRPSAARFPFFRAAFTHGVPPRL